MTRQKSLIFSLSAMFLILLLGVFNLEVVRGRSFRRLSDKNSIRLLAQNGSRGRILDRRGEIIADNKLSYDLLIMPQELGSDDPAFSQVARILETNPGDLKKKYSNGYISDSMPVTIAKNIDLKKAIVLEELKNDLPGLVIQANPLRSYPRVGLVSHVLGYVNEIDRWRLTKLADYGYKTKDMVGFGGVEEKYDYHLRQESGGLSVEVDHRARFVRTLGFKPPHNGKDVELTLDLRIQKIAQESLGERTGCVVIMGPDSGEIFAMVSSPGFNPAVFVDRKIGAVSRILNDPDAPLLNRAISSRYPAGSVFKLIVAAAGLENKKITPSTAFFCNGKLLIGKQEFACWHAHGQQDLNQAISHSCNVFFYKTGLLTGASQIHDYALKLGLGRVTGFDLSYEAAGFIPSPSQRKFKKWYDGDTANLSIGQGEVLVTPLQIARLMAVFANRGNLVTPYIVSSIDGRKAINPRRRITSLSLKRNNIEQIRKGLRNAIADSAGTANVLADLPVEVSGKTGTAQAPPGQAHAWFVGFFPSREAKYVICVFLERGGPGYVSCLVAKKIIRQMYSEGLI